MLIITQIKPTSFVLQDQCVTLKNKARDAKGVRREERRKKEIRTFPIPDLVPYGRWSPFYENGNLDSDAPLAALESFIKVGGGKR
ncbi:hypothetical protein CDAR_223741 [Caerostris darwini]|uniref:Uncharacterized protein n=1 Tax=Caerostris darwini TaxID=1538125 RepID=A0AAV4S0K2_9ARAC|nr:hypothetical protein CDAR_223741 [Caerostris darwini]